MIDYRIPGTKIPKFTENVRLRISSWEEHRPNTMHIPNASDYVSNGSKFFKGEEYIIFDRINSTDTNNWMVPISEFPDQDTFVLPERWYLEKKNTSIKNWKLVVEYFNTNTTKGRYTTCAEGFFYPNFRTFKGFMEGEHSGGFIDCSPYNTYTEITFEQFKNYVLKMNKEIIGYKLIKDYPNRDKNAGVEIGYVFSDVKSDFYTKYPEFYEPVYKEDNPSTKITIGESPFQAEVFKNGDIKIDKWTEGQGITIAMIIKILDKMETSIYTFPEATVYIQSIHIGCSRGPNVSKEQLENIVNVYNQLQ